MTRFDTLTHLQLINNTDASCQAIVNNMTKSGTIDGVFGTHLGICKKRAALQRL